MSKRRAIPVAGGAPLFRWAGRFGSFAELGTVGYPRPVRRQLMIVNTMALLIAIFSAVYAALFAVYDAQAYLSLVVINLLLVAVMVVIPLTHRLGEIAAPAIIAFVEYIALFFFIRSMGRDAGVQLNYIIGAAVPFMIFGREHMRLVVVVIVMGLILHLAAWFLFPAGRAALAMPPGLLANLYFSSAATTFCIIALIVGYAFSLADRARAEANALLANILPDAIAARLKDNPGEPIADSIPEASILFTDLVGFTTLALRLGVERTVAMLDEIVTEFDRLAAAHGAEKIKTIGDGYMAVAGVSEPAPDHQARLARMALALPGVVERLSETHDVDLKLRIGIASGPVMAGVIGTDKFSYDVWGETVNLASRLESHGLPGEVQVSGPVCRALEGEFVCEPRGKIEVKGVGPVETFLLKGSKAPGAGP
jgi:adenylate cyclase